MLYYYVICIFIYVESRCFLLDVSDFSFLFVLCLCILFKCSIRRWQHRLHATHSCCRYTHTNGSVLFVVDVVVVVVFVVRCLDNIRLVMCL